MRETEQLGGRKVVKGNEWESVQIGNGTYPGSNKLSAIFVTL